MSITQIDCYTWSRSNCGLPECASYVAFNPISKPGSFVFAASGSVAEKLGAQLASKLALENFVTSVIHSFSSLQDTQLKPQGLSLQVLEEGFRDANAAVYDFGHKLAAAGRLSACLIGLVCAYSVIAVGRVGNYCAYLWREGELFPFFESPPAGTNLSGNSDKLVGSQSLISVELASVPMQAGDGLFLISVPLSSDQEKELKDYFADAAKNPNSNRPTAGLAEVIEGMFKPKNVPDFVLLAQLGPQTIFLKNAGQSSMSVWSQISEL